MIVLGFSIAWFLEFQNRLVHIVYEDSYWIRITAKRCSYGVRLMPNDVPFENETYLFTEICGFTHKIEGSKSTVHSYWQIHDVDEHLSSRLQSTKALLPYLSYLLQPFLQIVYVAQICSGSVVTVILGVKIWWTCDYQMH